MEMISYGNFPVVSVLIPVHRWHCFIVDSINSILNQTYDSFELIVVCNGSDYELPNKIRSLWEGEERLKVLHTPIPGLVYSLTLGIEAARGDLIARMDSDDVSLPTRLEESVPFFFGQNPVDILSTAICLIDEHGDETGTCYTINRFDSYIRKTLPFRSLIPHPTVMLRRALLIEMGGYTFGSFSEDYDLWLRIRRETFSTFHHLGKPLLKYRVHPNQVTSKEKLSIIWKYDLSLRLREFLLTRDFRFILGMFYATFFEMFRRSRRLFWRS